MGKIHTTIGVYANLDWKINGVAEEDLEQHVQYNKDWRPGRALFVDGVCVKRGYLTDEEVKQFWETTGSKIAPKTVCTAPYV